MQSEVRLQKYLASCGIASRRKGEELILQGRVQVNGKIVDELGIKVIPGRDLVEMDGKAVKPENNKVYIMLNKPEGYITTSIEQFGRLSVMDLLKDVEQRIYPVGRLDKDTSGLLLLTSDGEFAYKLTHPKHHIRKKYVAEVRGAPDSLKLNKFKKGLKIEDYTTAPAEVRVLASKKNSSVLEIGIYEGKNRQVKKMCSSIGHPVIKLKRIAVGGLELKDLPEGKWRFLKHEEIKLFDYLG